MRSRARTRLGISITLVSAAAWTVLLVNPESMGHAHPVTGPVVSMIFEMLPSLLPGWVLMLVAMMSPKLFAPILDVIQGSFKHRRARAVALFTVAYIAVWTVAGCVLLAATMLLLYLSAPHSHLLALGAGLVVLVWQCSPAKQVCLNRCHYHPALAAFGIVADLDVLRFGMVQGVWCVGSCWALMLFPYVLPPQGHLLAMGVAAFVMCSESFERPRPLNWHLRLPGVCDKCVS